MTVYDDFYYECTEAFEIEIFDEDNDFDNVEFMDVDLESEWALSSCAPNSADIMLEEIGGSRWLGIHQDFLDRHFKKVRWIRRGE